MSYSFRVRVAKVEERYETIYDSESLSTAKTEGQVATKKASIGWFITLEGMGIAVHVGDKQPDDLAGGDEMVMELRKIRHDKTI